MEFLQYEFIRRSLIMGILVSLACGIIGSFVVVKRITFISGGISHSTFGGVGLAFLLGFDPMIGAAIFAVLSAFGIGIVGKRTGREDTAIGIIWAVGMALGVIFVGLSERYAPDLLGYLFGNILTIPLFDLYLAAALDVVILLTILLLYKDLLAVSFDEEFAEVIGLPVRFIHMTLLILVALTVVVLIKAVGIILLIALLTIPAATANLFTKNLKVMMLVATGLSVFFTFGGLVASFYIDIASGATIILLAGLVFALAWAVKSLMYGKRPAPEISS